MDELESLIVAQRNQVAHMLHRRREMEVHLNELTHKFEVAQAHLSGLLAAQEVIKARQEQEARPPVRRRQRRLTDQWRQILGMLATQPFTYDDLASVAVMQDHEISRDTLRSQMSVYKGSGLVEAIEDGVFRLTDRGRAAAGLSNEIGEEEEEESGDDDDFK